MEEGTIRPAAFEQFRLDTDASVDFHVSDGDLVESGQHWATLNSEQLQMERDAMDIEIRKRDLQRGRDLFEAEQARVTLLLEIQDAHRNLADLEDALESDALDEGLARRAREAIEVLNRRVEMLETRVSEQHRKEEARVKQEESDLQLLRTRKQLQALERRSELTSRHGGRLRISEEFRRQMELADEDGGIWAPAGEQLATIVDDSRYEIHVPANTTAMLQVPQEEIGIFLQDGQTGTLIPGRFLRVNEIESGLEINRIFVFQVPDERMDAAREASGQKQLVHVYRMFEREHHVIQKKDIAFQAPEVLRRSGWAGLVRHLWPDSRIIQVGPQSIALEGSDEN